MNQRLMAVLSSELSRGNNAHYWAEHYRQLAAEEKTPSAKFGHDMEVLRYETKYAQAQEVFYALLEGAAAYAPEEEGLDKINAEALWADGLKALKSDERMHSREALKQALKAQAAKE